MEYMESKMQEQIEAGIIEADRCYARIAELEEQNAALAVERDALAETVEALQSRISAAERVETIFSEAPELSFEECRKLFHEEIREIRAEAGRDGFIAGRCYGMSEGCVQFMREQHEKSADQYAESIRQEKK